MKTSLIYSFSLILLLSITPLCYGQFLQKGFMFEGMAPSESEIDSFPVYPGGDEALEKYIYTHLKEESKGVGQSLLTLSTYRVVVHFQVDEKGNVNTQMVRIWDSTPNMTQLDEKVKEMVRNMPAWSPCIIAKQATTQTIGLIINYDANKSQFDFEK
ncbi:hypothetical protein GXP67_24385 [Rhodocytophaga rosea]|uniref:Uncharacterized protein n=1 Tax=Rhodocytophaga rosea TaxID=2704465 RepID=A0A6C0GPL2_9BACT|nr:energy transducer TonB [Rhodocytophaga rosea]QHT69560.1 hypothetical protein GXP67_24385 [Rhodocytophaga rosea]